MGDVFINAADCDQTEDQLPAPVLSVRLMIPQSGDD